MRLQLRLTLWSILVMTAVVGCVSALDLINEINRQFDITLRRAIPIKRIAVSEVKRAVKRTPRPTAQESVRDDEILAAQLLDLLSTGQEVDEIVDEVAVCDPDGVIINDSDSSRKGEKLAHPKDFTEFVAQKHWWDKLKVLMREQEPYAIHENILSGNTTAMVVYVIIDPALMRSQTVSDIVPALTAHLWVALASIIASIVAVLILSATAFRPLGKLGEMLDLLARGEYEMQPVAPSADQFGIVASKVSRLGEVLRGAKSDISDLKGNVERLLDELEDAVLIFGRDRRLIAAAGSVERFLSRPRTALVGLTLTEIFPAGTTIGLLLSQAVQTARPIRNRRIPLQTSSPGLIDVGPLPMALLSVEFLHASSGGMVIRLRDPEATRQIGRELQMADRLSAISRLTGGVAHEVKNPLNAILMHVELAKMKLAHGDHDLGPQMDVISMEILRLDRVVKTFLDFTRPVQLHPILTTLQSLVQEISDLATPQAAGAGIALTVRQNEEPIAINGDADLLKQAILNVVVNAIEAMSAGGSLSIQSSVRGDSAEIHIADTGPGIPTEVRDNIYNLYFTTKARGSGIGLAMTFQIIQLHDGTIDFVSEPGKGTTFFIRLPVAAM
jgi:signal transduction histidine kinase/HAMP domain-containing protein